ncbi:hypothetical protein POM88_035702 [Heracleum sosnowskyi]|uniref:Uncharacterized protein n=1 Tax=Heracleum sosnowskyi TaxID=360622 RepID=A0AAD8HP02_9APIA|nr:hypothetical protein POM88_035702 [Heracleum sosnowskyi]
MKSKVLLGARISSAYIPKYRDAHGKLVEMKRNSARFRTALGIKVLEFNLESDKSFIIRLGNEMNKNSIYSLRAAIYQTGERDPELKELKEIMTAELERAERRLLTDYLRTVPDIEEIKYLSEFTLEASQSLLKSDGVRVYLVVGAYLMILEAIYLEDGKKQDILR